MYTNLKNVQIIISLLKQFGIRHLVISPGTRNTPLVHSVETDDFFVCYSIVDERSAGYVALGLAEALKRPVCVTCTAATATCNYMPAMQEAFERNIPLIALTADRKRYYRFNWLDQCINQVDMFKGYVKYAVDIPEIATDEDYWYCNRSVNEALLEIDHNGFGPVQINYQVVSLGDFSVKDLPVTRKINRVEAETDWQSYIDILRKKKKILVICGQHFDKTNKSNQLLAQFFERFNSVITSDYFANVNGSFILNSTLVGEVFNKKEIDFFTPDLVITFGTQVYSSIRYILTNNHNTFEHWGIDADGIVNDGLKRLTNLFECSPEMFFGRMSLCEGANDRNYYNSWVQRIEKFRYPDLKFTNFYVIKQVASAVSAQANMHLSVLDSIRLTNYIPINNNITCFGNIGADGIDGALSSFLGQASVTNELSVLVIGDLSYLYDLNASMIRMSNNVRILVINNFAGAEFHKNFGLKYIPTLNLHIAASHKTVIKDTMELNNMRYLSAKNSAELEQVLPQFMSESSEPILLEVFTDADTDANTLKEYWNINKTKSVKKVVRSIIGDKGVRILKNKLKK